jgi:hypothetical protein
MMELLVTGCWLLLSHSKLLINSKEFFVIVTRSEARRHALL